MKHLYGVLAVSLLAISICALLVDWGSICVNGLDFTLNDQVGYVSVARSLLDTGALDSKLTYPSILNQTFSRNSFYMPGQYWLLAATYRLFGVSVAATILPSLCSFVASIVLLFVIASRLRGSTVASYGCILFVFFPLNLIYAFTAMAEMPLIAAALLSFALFLSCPAPLRTYLGPLLLVLPLLFRETGAAVALPMACRIFDESKSRWRETALFLLLSAIVVVGVLLSPISSGRPSLLIANVFLGGDFQAVYADAFAAASVHPGVADWVAAIWAKFAKNTGILFDFQQSVGRWRLESPSMLFMVGSIPLGLFVRYQRRDLLDVGIRSMAAALLLLMLAVYTVWNYRGVRLLLMTQPFVSILLAEYLENARIARRTMNTIVVLFAITGMVAACAVLKEEKAINAMARMDTAFLESVAPPPQSLLISPSWLALDYANKNYPVRWAFLPNNLATLRLLDRKYPISTIVLPARGAQLTAGDALDIGMRAAPDVSHGGRTFHVFRRIP